MKSPVDVVRMCFPEGTILVSMKTKVFNNYIREYIPNPIVYRWKGRRYVITTDNVVFEEILNNDTID